MSPTRSSKKKGVLNLAIFLPNLNGGGAQKANARLANALVQKGVQVTLLVARGGGVVAGMLHPAVRVVDLRAPRVLFSVPGLVRFLNRTHPHVLFSVQTNANLAALLAHRLARASTRLVISERNAFTAAKQANRSLRDRLMRFCVPLFYPHADLITAVSQGVADDLKRYLAGRRIITLYNPVLADDLFALAQQSPSEPWLIERDRPVILAVGRLEKQKGFDTLLQAFKIVQQAVPARLLILGEGRQRAELEKMVTALGLGASVKMPGFAANPYACMSRADVFVLSSRREGLPNALIEAMACRVPVVSSDCPFGPREILAGGRFGRLVPVGDALALAAAVLDVLQHQPDVEPAFHRAQDFSAEKCAEAYLRVFHDLLTPSAPRGLRSGA